ncbi:MAG: hypothetical protein ABI981_02105 [Betaproteobacteria bacterium]
MRSLLKSVVVAAICFVLIGAPIMSIYLGVQSSLVNHWSADQVPLPMTIVFSVLGTIYYGMFIVPFFGVPMGVAALAFVACMPATMSGKYPVGIGAITGATVGLLTAMVWRAAELQVTPDAWLWGPAIACVIGAGAAGMATAWFSRRGLAVHAVDAACETDKATAARRTRSVPARLVIVALAATAAYAVLWRSVATVDDLRFRRDAESAALAMRASPMEVQSARIGDLLDAAPKLASISERGASTPIAQRAIRNRPHLAAELAVLKARGGAIVKTRYNDFAATSTSANDLSRGLQMVFNDTHLAGTSTETLGYEWRNGQPVLTMYNYVYQGPRDDPVYEAMLITR